MRTAVVVFVLLALSGALTYLMMTGGGTSSDDGETITTASGLQYIDLKPGTGRVANEGDRVKVHYTGKLRNGTKFDSSYDRGKPFDFSLGAHQVIKGWDEGIAGMKEGGRRKLIIPANLAYGDQDKGTIPPNSTLIFDVELLKVN
jgi:FKBP-type peptidyl-prolyl cis-trans isomerase